MTKTDVQVQRDVIDELRFDPRVGSGRDRSRGEERRCHHLGTGRELREEVRGGTRCGARLRRSRALRTRLTVALPSAFKRTDTDVAHSVLTALRLGHRSPRRDDQGARRGRLGVARR